MSVREEGAKPAGCPGCGGPTYYVSDRANGWVQYLGGFATGEEERANGEDGLRYTRSATVTCVDCGRRSPRPEEAERAP